MKDILTLSLLVSLLLLSHASDITQMLNQYTEFSTFNSYLTQTNLAAEVNSRQTITVLVVDNAAVSSLSAKPMDQLKNILSVHIVLDYYDVPKLQQLSGNSALLTTLFQSTGSALGQQGFLNVTRFASGSIAFGSAMPGSPLGSNLVKSVVSQPYNISVVQISNPIIPQGIDGAKVSAPPSTTPTATAATPPPPASSATPPQTQSAGAAEPPMPLSSGTTPPPPPSTGTPPPPPPPPAAAASVIPPAISQLITPATAPPQPGEATVPTTAPPTPTTASAPPPSTNAPLPSTVTTTPTSAPTMAAGPATATTPSASPASSPTASAPGPAMGPTAETPTLLEPAGTTPAEPKPKKNACTALDAGLALLSTIALSTLYLASTI